MQAASAAAEKSLVSMVLCGVVRLAVRNAAQRGREKWTCPVKPAVQSLEIGISGCSGDYNHYRSTKKGGTIDRAVSLMTLEAYESLQEEKYQVGPGDFGENLTLVAPESALKAGVRLRVLPEDPGEPVLELELSEPMTPCKNLEQIPLILDLDPKFRAAFVKTCKGRRGWYARVVSPGSIHTRSKLQLLSPFAAAPESSPAEGGTAAAAAESSSHGQPAWKSHGDRGRSTRRWHGLQCLMIPRRSSRCCFSLG